MQVGDFKKNHEAEARKRVAQSMRDRYDQRIPVIVEYAHDLPHDYRKLIKQKFLVPGSVQFGHFIRVIKNTLKVKPETAIFLLVDSKVMVKITDTFEDLYDKYKCNDDLFLYLALGLESTFGSPLAMPITDQRCLPYHYNNA